MLSFWLDVQRNIVSFFSVGQVLLFLLAGIILMAAAGKLGLLRRSNRWHAMAVKIYYPYVPLALLLVGFSWSLVSTMERAFLYACDNARESIVTSSVDTARAVWKDVSSRAGGGNAPSFRELSVTVAADYVNLYYKRRDSADSFAALSPMVDVIQEGVASGMAVAVERILITKAAHAARQDEGAIRTLWNAGIVTAMQDGLAVDILRQQILDTSARAYEHVRNLALLLFAVPVLETAVSLFIMRRRRVADKTGLTALFP